MIAAKTGVWDAVLEDIQKQVGQRRFSLWFHNITPIRIDGGTAVFGVPNLFVQEWLQTHFADSIRQALAEKLEQPFTIKFVVDPALFRQSRALELDAGAEIVEAVAESREKEGPKNHEGLRPDYTIENFIVGPQNKLAHACAMEIIESRGNRLNPFFVHSGSGLGKTHLLQAIFNELQRRDDGRKAEYLSAESFANQFIYAMRTNRLDAFRNRYRNADVLLVDDVHFLNQKSGFQEELLHTYEELNRTGRQLVLASDVHPKMLTKVKQSLVSRFGSGMVVKISQPDFATRVAILKSKLQLQRRRVSEEVIRYIARGFEGSVRELSGALTLVQAHAALTGEKIDVTLAKKALTREGADAPARGDIETVERTVSEHYGLKPADLRARRIRRSMRIPRYLCMYLARKCTTMSCREIAHHFNSANHSNVIFSVARVEEMMSKDKAFAELVSSLSGKLRKN